MKLLTRFALVFDQTYRRFLDLQMAEIQAMEAIKQASLDRVRGRNCQHANYQKILTE